MRIRFRGPFGGGSLEVTEDATVAELIAALKAEAGFGDGAITVKFGWPLQTLGADQGNLQVRSLGLQQENLTIVPNESSTGEQPQSTAESAPRSGKFADSGAATALDEQLAANLSYGTGEDVKVEMPESRTSLGMYSRATA
jgi:ubiquitin thioesterase OTU1